MLPPKSVIAFDSAIYSKMFIVNPIVQVVVIKQGRVYENEGNASLE